MRTLINLSNHPSSRWSEKQKEGWDIIDIPFPNIPPEIDTIDLVENYVTPYVTKIAELIKDKTEGEFYIMLQGEFSFCFLLYDVLKNNFVGDTWHFCVPTTERVVTETVKDDGVVEKTTKFEFKRWRVI